MDRLLASRLNHLSSSSQNHVLSAIRVGLERESLRVTHEGAVSRKNHPLALGSALTHPSITTDYAESLLEFVTTPHAHVDGARDELRQLMAFSARRLDHEYLWSASMPCALTSEADIRIAEYGNSNLGQLKHLYRVGLAHRYGKAMQMIAGIHFNFSFLDEAWQALAVVDSAQDTMNYRSQRYLDLARNVQRTGFCIPYFFGASPAVDRSFFMGRGDQLTSWDADTRVLPQGTALRLSDIGYSNRKCRANIPLNTLSGYLDAIHRALITSCPSFEAIGVIVDGQRRQLNTHMLQIEAEHYAGVRIKNTPQDGETASVALSQRGIAYIEMRLLDVSPFDPVGIDLNTLRFVQAWLTTCVLMSSPPMHAEEFAATEANKLRVATRGREEGVDLMTSGDKTVSQREALIELLDNMSPVCAILGADYVLALEEARRAIDDPARLPSARLLKELREQEESFLSLGLRYAEAHTKRLIAETLDPDKERAMAAAASKSLEDERALVAADHVSFEEYLEGSAQK
jgi:glutamate--cysteine ligase